MFGKVRLPRPKKTQSEKPSATKVIALALSVLAGVAVYYALTQLYTPVPVVVAARDVGAVETIDPVDVAVTKVAKRDRHPQAFVDPRQVLGSYAAVNIFRGQQVIAPQVVRDPGKMVAEMLSMKADETFVTLKSQEASWPPVLKSGDLVTVVAVFPDGEVRDVAVGRVVTAAGSSVVQDIKSLREAEAKSSQTTVTIATKVDQAKMILAALKQSKGVYLLPRHPALGGV